ncbi:DUF1569 domain-containing protein [Robiginitalea sp. IMCC43444]|uniref:DUF1569 domain-containing protein n=1 Tax=Robiginitalea sp. IMCC43444 TaxID=3459121 RepID=UPI004041DD07
MKSLLETDGYEDIKSRLKKLQPEKKPLWGKMDAAQMVWHCQIPLQVGIKNKLPKKKGNLLMRLFFKKSLYNDKPWRKNLPTIPSARATESKDFNQEYGKLLELVDTFHHLKSRESWNPHPMFGSLTSEQWGKLEYKHLDHHLRQFDL